MNAAQAPASFDSAVMRELLATDGDRAAARDVLIRWLGEDLFADLAEDAGGEDVLHELAARVAEIVVNPPRSW